MTSLPSSPLTASKSVIQVDEQQIRSHVEEVVRSSVEETLNGLLNAEADQCTDSGELCELLRREGLYFSSLARWRRERTAGTLDSTKRGRWHGAPKTSHLGALENQPL